jgi:hypothetical protein
LCSGVDAYYGMCYTFSDCESYLSGGAC